MDQHVNQAHATKIKRAYEEAQDKYTEHYIPTLLGRVRVLIYEGGDHYTPTLFLHGWGGDLHVWFPVIDGFREQEITHVLVDLPGFGKSDTPDGTVGVEEYAAALEEVLRELNIKRATLIGHSFGGQVAAQFAVAYKELIDKLVLADAACIRRHSKRLREMFASAVKPIFRLPLLRNVSDTLLTWIVGDDFQTNPQLYETMKRVVNQDLGEKLPAIEAPTLVVWGEDDAITPLEQAYTISQKITNSLLVVLPATGHFSSLDKPEEFSEAVLSFITS